MEIIETPRSIQLSINRKKYKLEVNTGETLLEALREKLGLTGAKKGCDEGECGACTVLVNGEPLLSCLTLAVECDGWEIETIEGMANPKTGDLHVLQQSFIDNGGIQCGFCTPGMILSSKALLDKNLTPAEDDIRDAINGNICRCTGYSGIIESVKEAAKILRRKGNING